MPPHLTACVTYIVSVTQEDAKVLSGFDQAFQANDANHDGKLTADEFNKAWSMYSGKSM